MPKVPELRLNRTIGGRNDAAASVHPWIFSGSVSSVNGEPAPGDVVRILDAKGGFVGYGHFSPHSGIRARILSSDENSFPDRDFIFSRISRAIEFRKRFAAKLSATDAVRLVYAEADELPGLIADRYSKTVVLQCLTSGMDRLCGDVAGFIKDITGAECVIARNDSDTRSIEGLAGENRILTGECSGSGKPVIIENGMNFIVDLLGGQKTGFYLDQRDNRKALSEYVTEGCSVLDCFSYTGGFSVYAAEAGAKSLTLVDESQGALDAATANFEINGLSRSGMEKICGDAFQVLRGFRDRARNFDIVILDPPKFAPTKSNVEKAMRGYKDINLLGMKLVKEGGLLATFSCSSGLRREQFRNILEWAASDARLNLQIIEQLTQPFDHPVSLSFPESEYLKGFLCRVMPAT